MLIKKKPPPNPWKTHIRQQLKVPWNTRPTVSSVTCLDLAVKRHPILINWGNWSFHPRSDIMPSITVLVCLNESTEQEIWKMIPIFITNSSNIAQLLRSALSKATLNKKIRKTAVLLINQVGIEIYHSDEIVKKGWPTLKII